MDARMADHETEAPAPPVDFIRAIVDEDLASGKHHGRVATQRRAPLPHVHTSLTFGWSVMAGGETGRRNR